MRSGGQLAVVLAARAQRRAVQAGVVGLRFGSVERGQERAEGSPPWRAKARAATLYSVGSGWTQTMKQPFASRARLRGGGHILWAALQPWPIS